MNLSRHLRHFVVVAEELHFGRAAEVLGIAQPPLSQSIRRLEDELGVLLFDRSRRQVALTAAGTLLLDEARALLAREDRLRAVMREARDGERGTLRLGVPPDVPAVALHALLDRIAEHAPLLDVRPDQLTTAEQLRRLSAADLDIGLVHHPVDPAGLVVGPVAEAPLGVVLPRDSAPARRREVALADLDGTALVAFPRADAPGWHDHLLAACRANGFRPGGLRSAGSTEFLLGLVLAGHGVALVPESVARREPRLAWRPLAGEPLHRRVSAVWRADAEPPGARRVAEAVGAAFAGGPPDRPLADPGAPLPWSVVYTPPGRAEPDD